MTLEEMERDSRNTIVTGQETTPPVVVCDPCRQKAKDDAGYISGYCLMTVHNPLYCPMPEICTCDCHAHATKPDLNALVQKERKGFGQGHRSDNCWKDGHSPSDCKNAWCDCWCHKGEANSARVERSTKAQKAAKDLAVRIGSKIGHRIMLADEEGHVRQVIMLPSGEIMEIQ